MPKGAIDRDTMALMRVMEQQARAVQKALRDGSSYRIADRIRERSEFYSGWLEPRLKEFAENNGMAP